MLRKLKKILKMEKKPNPGIFSESPLKTSFYEELQKNGWCEIIDDKPDNLTELIQIKIRKTKHV
ncbi:hypothetical protein QE109_12005 [Fusibacter bizertensis]|uniref:Uncharacterized protein n=1 Tax=Fusibacter bizertensis TaxID=1488331 RepID=A0ABT6NEN0_9FIRM|nr:hypothetical protein [Fusibacter bizertensis]MDH8678879.1 hypothetical protein [Fusibacter bizertensis]